MRELVRWLRSVEELANGIYTDASECLADDPDFSAFLRHLAEDEASHYHIMGSAEALLDERVPVPGITLDRETRANVEDPLIRCRRQLESESFSKSDLIAALLTAEHSEWNSIFLYVVRQFQHRSRPFQKIAAAISAHAKRIDDWASSLPADLRKRVAQETLPVVWERRFLVVEDDQSLRELFERVLAREGGVVTATNGKEGLELAQQQFFDVIVSDQEMPIMTGTELFRLGVELDPTLGQHFILCTGNLTPEVRSFCRAHGVRVLEKPVSLAALRNAILETLESRWPSQRVPA